MKHLILSLFTLLLGSSLFAQMNNALNFDGDDDFIQLTDPLAIASGDFTVEFQIKVPLVGTAGLAAGERVGILLGSYPTNPHFNVEIHGGGQLRFYWNFAQVDLFGTTDVRDNIWHHVAFVRDTAANKLSIFIDGVLEVESASAGPSIAPQTFRIGGDNRSNGGPNFHGLIDEARIWNVARTPAELIANKDCAIIGNEAGLVAYYNFNQGIPAGDNATDTTLTNLVAGGMYNGMLENFALIDTASNWVSHNPIPSVAIVSDATSDTITAGTNITFIATPTNGGSTVAYQWYKNGNAVGINAATYSDAMLADGDSVWVAMSSTDDCGLVTTVTSATITMLVITNTFDINTQAAKVILYPNPVKDVLTVKNAAGFVTIYNALGQPVRQLEITDAVQMIEVNELQKGVYTLQIRKADGTAVVKQFVK